MNQLKRFAIDNFPECVWESPDCLNATDIIRRNDVLNLRRAILHAEENNIGSKIRKFMIRPVLTQIDAHQPLEYLTEMRQVSVLFITLKPRECPFLQLITIVSNTYDITCEIVYKSMGCVNKIILFDKDVMILVIFGLRGFKHESEAQAALKCAHSIKKSVSALDGVLEVSIGVTTGQVYCGVVGHPLRREFTVIGAVVNKAARLMCNFRNKITCDETTFVKSKMSSNGFTLQPKTELKGIVRPGKIYEYSEDIRVKELFNIPMTQPLLNRSDELEYFNNWLDDAHKSYRDFDALLLVGDPRIGKSRLMQWMLREAQNRSYKTCCINLTTVHSATPYLALSQIINQILGLDEPIVGFIKEERVVQLLNEYSDDLCYLNHIIKVRFAYHEGVNFQNEQMRKEKAQHMFSKLLKSVKETYVIFLDDLQNLDSSSWEFICIMFSCLKIFIVLTVTRGKFSSVQSWLYDIFINNSIRKILLGPLSSGWIAPLACQILDVKAVPYDLCNAIRLKCNGMPGLIENFIIHLFSNGALELKKITMNEIENLEEEDLQFPEPELLHPQAINIKDQVILDQHIQEDASEELAICIVTKKEELKAKIDVQNIDALVMIQIDSLTPYQQLLLKIASVIGNVLSRDLLENIMYENDLLVTAKSVKRLFAMRILSCANTKSTPNTPEYFNNLICNCNFDFDPENSEDLPKYSFCKVMKFRNKNTRKTCYELLPINQKKEFHSRIVHYLQNHEHKCTNCGGSLTVVRSSLSLHEEAGNYDLYSITSQDSSPSNNDSEADSVNTHGSSTDVQRISATRKVRSEIIDDHRNYSQCTTTRARSETTRIQNNSNSSNRDQSRVTSFLKARVDSESQTSITSSTKRVTLSSLHFKPFQNNNRASDIDLKIFDMLRPVIEANTIFDWHNIGVIDSEDELSEERMNRKIFSIKVEKGISETDINRCTCSELNIIICEQLIHHALQAEMKSKAVKFMIKYSYLNTVTSNFDVILPQLENAESICSDKNIPESVISVFEKRRFLGRIYSIRAAVFLMTAKLTSAKIEMEKATRIYHINLHKVSEYFRFKKIISVVKRKKQRVNDMILKSDSVFCLNVATLLHLSIGEDKISRILSLIHI